MDLWFETAIAAIAVLLGVAALRALPRLVHDRRLFRSPFPLAGDQGDAMSHLIMTDLVRRNGHRIPDGAPQYLLGEHLDYPLFFHKLASYVPRARLERWEWVMTPLMEGVHAALLFVMAILLLGRFTEVESPVSWALAVMTTYATTPLLARSWRRTGFFGERAFGYLFGHLYFVSLVVFLLEGEPLFVAAALLTFTIAAASAKFATQAMVFLSLALAALLWDVRPLLMLGASLVFAVLISRGYIWTLVRGQIRHSALYCRHLVHLSDGTKGFSDADLKDAFRRLLQGSPRQAQQAFRKHPYSRMLALLPWLAPFTMLTAAWMIGRTDGDLVRVILAWGWSSIAIAMLTMTDALKFLGEGERYLEYGVFPMALSPLLLPEAFGGTSWFLLVAYCVYAYVRQLRNGALLSLPSDAAAELAAFMARQKPATLYAVPGRLVLPLCYATDHRAAWHLAHIDGGERLTKWLSQFTNGAVYPFCDPEAARAAGERFGADLIVAWKSGIKAAAEAWGLRYDLGGRPVRFENDDFIVYEARRTACAEPGGTATDELPRQAAHG
jgi:hypothetical protein